jgi:hypothetical protein
MAPVGGELLKGFMGELTEFDSFMLFLGGEIYMNSVISTP